MAASNRRLRIEWRPGAKITARLALPSGGGRTAVLLAHGAGAPQDHPFMTSLRKGLAGAGVATMTFDYPYAEAGRRVPDRLPVLLECHRAAVSRLRDYTDRIVLAGKSMGGRVASHLAAEGEPCAALVFYGYPLVAPSRGTVRSTDHLETIPAPMLFLTGSRDRLAPLDVLRPTVARIRRATLEVVDEGDHSFNVPKRTGLSPAEVMADLVARTAAWLQAASG
jgi:predicted alpha/beta-hydrolase family hydrolase